MKDTDILVASCGQTEVCRYVDNGFAGGGDFYTTTAITHYNNNVMRVDPWGSGSFKCKVEVLQTVRQPKGTMQIRWSGPANPNSLTYIFRHHDTGDIYTKIIPRTDSNDSFVANLSGSAGIVSIDQELIVQAGVGQDGVDSQYVITFTSPTILV